MNLYLFLFEKRFFFSFSSSRKMGKHLTPYEKGLIQGECRARKNKNICALARAFGRSERAINSALEYRGEEKKVRKPRVLSKVRERRKLVVKFSEQLEETEHGPIPKCGTSPAILKELPARFRSNEIKQDSEERKVRRDYNAMGCKSKVRQKVPIRDAEVHAKRKAFAKFWIRRKDHCKYICFSDEHTCSTNDHSKRYQVVLKGPRGVPLPRERRRLQNVHRCMVWACVGVDYKSEIVLFPQEAKKNDDGRKKGRMTYRLNADSYIRKCLSPVVATMAHPHKIFQQDNASPHGKGSENSRAVKYLTSRGVKYVESWPPNSPDCSMIELLWPELNERVAKRKATTLDELKAAIVAAWRDIPQSTINKHVLRFHGYMEKVYACNGEVPHL